MTSRSAEGIGPDDVPARQRPGRGIVAAILLLTILSSLACRRSAEDPILVLAAASTIDAVEAALAEFDEREAPNVVVSFGPTSTLARQIVEGAPADLMLSASVDWADYVEDRVDVARRVALVGNELVLVAPARDERARKGSLRVLLGRDLGRIAIADPESVPAGIYSREALRHLGLWETVRPRLIPTVDVRAALALVESTEADGGFVYRTDAAGSDRVSTIAVVDPTLHAAIEYPLLLLAGAQPEAKRLFEFLASDGGRAHFVERGFTQAGR